MDYVKSEIVIFDKATGAKVMLTPLSLKPTDPKQGWVALPPDFNEATFTWNATTRVMVEDLAKVRAQLLAGVKAEAELRKMAFLSAGGAKKAEYPKKAAEVAYYDSLAGLVGGALAAISAMPANERQAKFPYALASAKRRKETTIAPAIARFRSGITSSSPVEAIAAEEEFACEALNAATTIAAARAAAAVTWPS